MPARRRFIPAGAGNTAGRFRTSSARTVHPRWRGEHQAERGTHSPHCGSSPLARGTRSSGRSRRLSGRFIPAGAGNTSCGQFPFPIRTVHPRWRGEHDYINFTGANGLGSSPLARGTRDLGGGGFPSGRFIPAGAGNTRNRSSPAPDRPVHPRWRGEHINARPLSITSNGSSPLARGTPPQPGGEGKAQRFIPAGAGNTGWLQVHQTPQPVHPRWRGEHACPRLGEDALGRFIPAGAGNTTTPVPGSARRSVHPRWRGEHEAYSQFLKRVGGSSPLARGTQVDAALARGAARFIPAGAGNTHAQRPSCLPQPVHPRWRGEHRLPMRCSPASCGSSPLARGTLSYANFPPRSPRFIPAGAGNTNAGFDTAAAKAVHPRWRGEHDNPRLPRRRRRRFIPAGAGNTLRSWPLSP